MHEAAEHHALAALPHRLPQADRVQVVNALTRAAVARSLQNAMPYDGRTDITRYGGNASSAKWGPRDRI